MAMRMRGLEPPRPKGHTDLNRARLPIPPHPRGNGIVPGAGSYDRSVSTQPLRDLLERAFPDATELDVIDRTGGGDHFQVVVTAPSLSGLTLVEQHRRVYEALSAPLGDGTIHELRIKTKGAS
jgi:stress-induced morphogen